MLVCLDMARPSNPDETHWIGRLVMCIDLNAFYPSCEELRDASLKGKPHATIMTDYQEGNKITKGVVASSSYEARSLGVRSAMPLSKAIELCPDLILRPVDIPYYRQISDEVMDLLDGYADILEQTSIDEAYLDCTKKIISNYNSSVYSNVERHAMDIKSAIKGQCNLKSSIGVAPTKSSAKIASNIRKPDGLTIFYPNKLQRFLKNMEVDKISGVGTKTERILDSIGIKTIGQLANYDVQILMDRFGKKNGLWMWQAANGKDEDPVLTREDRISLSNERTLESFTRDKEVIKRFLLNELAGELYDRLSKQGYGYKAVAIKMVKSDFSIESREISFSKYQFKKEGITSVLEGLLNRFPLKDSDIAVRKVGIKVSKLTRIENKKSLKSSQTSLLDYY